MEKYLEVKPSHIEGAGNGLFTAKAIAKGTKIVEYKGKVITWAYALEHEEDNPYLYYVSEEHVINGKGKKMSLASYINDARGITRTKGLNSKYVEEDARVYVVATKDIAEQEELLVGYGKDYWDTVRKNNAV